MLSVQELRTLASSLSREKFRGQLGPFVLVQRPPKEALGPPAVPANASNPWGEPEGTAMARPKVIEQGILSLIFQFEELVVATLPPMGGVMDLTVGRLPDCDLVIEDPS
ncbi:MAG TPA: FHA domain-containing protein, partial [Myxococcaceae bacterium]|nr:FHA domain-containing protein [Myxococcaceae bacterium]